MIMASQFKSLRLPFVVPLRRSSRSFWSRDVPLLGEEARSRDGAPELNAAGTRGPRRADRRTLKVAVCVSARHVAVAVLAGGAVITALAAVVVVLLEVDARSSASSCDPGTGARCVRIAVPATTRMGRRAAAAARRFRQSNVLGSGGRHRRNGVVGRRRRGGCRARIGRRR